MKTIAMSPIRHSGCVLRAMPALMLLIAEMLQAHQARSVCVGIYDNPPKVQAEDGGKPSGIFIDIIEGVAKLEQWDVSYVNGTWQDGLDRLTKGEIDLMPDVAFSDDRSLRFDFNKLPVLNSWLQVFCLKSDPINTVSQLEGKRIAVLEGSIQQQVCDDLRRRLGIYFATIPSPDYAGTIRRVEHGEADAVIVSRFYGYASKRDVSLVPTAVILHPTSLHFVAAKGRHGDLLERIDHHLAAMMNDPNSVYYESLSRWLHKKPDLFIPRSVFYLIAIISAAAFLFFIFSLVLKRQVTARTGELRVNNERLRTTLRELETAHEAAMRHERLHMLGQLTSGIAHDFNNLLAPVVSYTDLMLKDGQEQQNAATRQNLEAIKNAAEHGTELVRRMQQFCRSAEVSEHRERIDVNDVVDEVLELTRVRLSNREHLEKKRIEIVRDAGKGVVMTGNRTDLHEMILNLVLNAADAMPDGGKIEIRTKKTDTAVIVAIKDNGTGMTEEVRGKCLQPFFTTKGDAGTGMGLAMVHNIVRKYDGIIEIDSSLNKGTVFTITLPS